MQARPLQVFGSRLRPCPYLDGRRERTVAAELSGPGAGRLYDAAARAGWRRSHNVIYRPACPGCDSCRPVRVVASRFRPRRTLGRVLRANRDLEATITEPMAGAEHFELFTRYQKARHAGGGMDGMAFEEFRALMEVSTVETFMAEFRDGTGDLKAVILADRLSGALSAVYSFFDPGERRRGLGTFMVVWLIERARALGLAHVYLGYWIRGSDKMAYKTRFRPLEALAPDGWVPIEEMAEREAMAGAAG